MTANVFNIQRFSVHDGDGIRTTVFFSGCPLSCLWCHNPEGISGKPSLLYNSEKCIGCGGCAAACPHGAVSFSFDTKKAVSDHSKCTACGICVPVCRADARAIAGVPYTVEEIVKICTADRMFYEESGGGVTLSGGEVMAQKSEFLLPLLKRLRGEDISVNIDTCGLAEYDKFKSVAPYADNFLYDIKSADNDKHKYCTGVGNELILDNLRRLSDDGASIIIRVPVIAPADGSVGGFDGANYTDSDVEGLIRVLQGINYRRVHLLPYHNTGEYKRASLGQTVRHSFSAPSSEHIEKIKKALELSGVAPVVIGG